MRLFVLTPLIVLAMFQYSERVVIVPGDASPQTKASLAGTVISEATGEPISGAMVTMSRQFATLIDMLSEDGNLQVIAPVRTDSKGRFSFPAIAAAAYNVTVQSRGYVNAASGLTLSASQHVENFMMKLTYAASIKGYVRSREGQPLAGIPVQLFQRNDNGVLPGIQTKSAVDGSYALEDFPSGDFILAAGSPMDSNGQVAASFAKTVTTRARNIVPLDVTLDAKERHSVHGIVHMSTAPQGLDTRVSWNVMVTPASRPRSIVAGANLQYDARTGNFQVSGLAPGIYRIDASLRPAPASSRPTSPLGFCGFANILVSQDNVGGLEITLRECL